LNVLVYVSVSYL